MEEFTKKAKLIEECMKDFFFNESFDIYSIPNKSENAIKKDLQVYLDKKLLFITNVYLVKQIDFNEIIIKILFGFPVYRELTANLKISTKIFDEENQSDDENSQF